MTNDPYSHGRLTGVSDGSVAGNRGADDYRSHQRHLARNNQLLQSNQAGARNVGSEVGDGLMAIIAGLFLHRYFCFVGFWLICFGLLMAAASNLGPADSPLRALPGWYVGTAAVVPVVLAIPLRKIIPTVMRWIFFAALAAWVIGLVVTVMKNR